MRGFAVGSRRGPLPTLRTTLAIKLVTTLGLSLAEAARQLGVTTSGMRTPAWSRNIA